MELYVGGRCQGKLEYVLEKRGREAVVADGESYPLDRPGKADILNHFHLLVRRLIACDRDIAGYVQEILAANPQMAVICDEVGMGIVPADAFERRYREAVGRCCCVLAGQAGHVERILCGRGMKIK